MQLFGPDVMAVLGGDLMTELARLLFGAIAATLAVGAFIAGRLSRHRSRVRFRRADLVASSIVIEM